MNKYSLTYTGIFTMMALPLLGQLGFSDQCSGEVANILLMAPGAIMGLYGRYRNGGVDKLGRRID